MSLSHADRPVIALGERAFLRPIAENDVVPAYVDGLNDPQVNRFLVGPRKQRQTMETVRAFVRMNWQAADGVLFGIFVGGSLRGTLRLHDIASGSAYVGIALFDRAVWGQGWARKAISAVAKHASEELGVREFKAGIEHDNVGSQRAFAAAGFVRKTASRDGDGSPGADLWIYTTSQDASATSAPREQGAASAGEGV